MAGGLGGMGGLDDAADEELMQAVARGDGEAFAVLMRRHMQRVRSIGWRMLGSAHAADDLAQEVFLRIWRNPAAFDARRGPFTHWLARVASNAAIDRLRQKQAVSLDDEPGQALSATLADPAPDPEAATARQQQVEMLRAALAQLPQRQRLAISLAHDLGHSQAEIAAIMETSVEAVESLLARGRRKLKEMLRRQLQEGARP